MTAKTMLFGPIGRQVEFPWPQSGMDVGNVLSSETTTLLSGELSVYRAPLTYKTYNMSWKGGAAALQPLLDVHSGVYGKGPYYITDPVAGLQGTNLLPSKWASAHLLAHVGNGWCAPVTAPQTLTPERRQVTFTGNPDDTDYHPTPLVVPVIPGQPLLFKAWGSRTGTATVAVSKYSLSTDSWSAYATYLPTSSSTDAPYVLVSQTESDLGDIKAIKIAPYVAGIDTLTLQHLDVSTTDYRTAPSPFRMGQGIGPVQFTGNSGGKLDSVTIDRKGLSLDVAEVSRDPNI